MSLKMKEFWLVNPFMHRQKYQYTNKGYKKASLSFGLEGNVHFDPFFIELSFRWCKTPCFHFGGEHPRVFLTVI